MPPLVNKQKPPTPTTAPKSNPRVVKDELGGIDAWGSTEWIRMLMYGQSGTGKTTSWASFPGTTLTIICSGGKQPGEMKSIDTPENRKRMKAKIVSSIAQVKGYLDMAKEGQFDNVVLDHASGLQDLCLKEILGLEELPVAATFGICTKAQWGQVAIMMKEVLREILSLSCNTIVIAQERVLKGGGDDESGSGDGNTDVIQPTVCAAMMPSVVQWLNPAVDYSVQTFIRPKMKKITAPNPGGKPVITEERVRGEVEYCIRTGPHDVFLTKFRKPRDRVLPECLVIGRTDSAYEKLMTLIRG